MVLAVLLIFSIVISISLFKIHPVIITQAVSMAETISLNSANEAVLNILESQDISYDDIVNLTYNNDGYVTSLEIDVYSVNFLKSKISGRISDIMQKEERYKLGIPIGTFFNSDFTNGLGPAVNMGMQITTTAFVDFRHEFKAAGINQVLHIVFVDIKIKGNLLIIGYRKGFETSTSAIAAQTVIVGKTPDAFTNVIESQTDNTGGLINDYGAIAE